MAGRSKEGKLPTKDDTVVFVKKIEVDDTLKKIAKRLIQIRQNIQGFKNVLPAKVKLVSTKGLTRFDK